jgi:hypothetical protein
MDRAGVDADEHDRDRSGHWRAAWLVVLAAARSKKRAIWRFRVRLFAADQP